MTLILVLGRQRQGIFEFEASLVYKVSFRTSRAATQRNSVSKNQKKKKKEEEGRRRNGDPLKIF